MNRVRLEGRLSARMNSGSGACTTRFEKARVFPLLLGLLIVTSCRSAPLSATASEEVQGCSIGCPRGTTCYKEVDGTPFFAYCLRDPRGEGGPCAIMCDTPNRCFPYEARGAHLVCTLPCGHGKDCPPSMFCNCGASEEDWCRQHAPTAACLERE